MDKEVICAIERILDRGERVELMKGPGGEVKVLRVRRETVPVTENRPQFAAQRNSRDHERK